jgi:ribonuclease P protein component
VLPSDRRVRRREDFTAAVRGGRRAATSGLVVHVAMPSSVRPQTQPARVGFVIGRAVGSAVTRNRLRRQLRHLLAPRLERLPSGTVVVVRATAAATQRTSRELAAALDVLLARTQAVTTR